VIITLLNSKWIDSEKLKYTAFITADNRVHIPNLKAIKNSLNGNNRAVTESNQWTPMEVFGELDRLIC
jgi:hypothetical protein